MWRQTDRYAVRIDLQWREQSGSEWRLTWNEPHIHKNLYIHADTDDVTTCRSVSRSDLGTSWSHGLTCMATHLWTSVSQGTVTAYRIFLEQPLLLERLQRLIFLLDVYLMFYFFSKKIRNNMCSFMLEEDVQTFHKIDAEELTITQCG